MSEFNCFKEKTAVAIITCNREEFLHKALSSIDKDSEGEIFSLLGVPYLNEEELKDIQETMKADKYFG
jgi:hypothetical protein